MKDLLRRIGKTGKALTQDGKSVGWKLALAAALKARTTVTNRWRGETLHLGNLREVSRQVVAWARHPDPKLARKLQFTPSPKA